MAHFPATASSTQHYGSCSVPQSAHDQPHIDLEAGSLAATTSEAEAMPVTLTRAAAQHRYEYGADEYDANADEDEEDDEDPEAGRGRSGPLGKRPRNVGRGLRGGQEKDSDWWTWTIVIIVLLAGSAVAAVVLAAQYARQQYIIKYGRGNHAQNTSVAQGGSSYSLLQSTGTGQIGEARRLRQETSAISRRPRVTVIDGLEVDASDATYPWDD